MKKVITISGKPGCGKSTVANIVGRRLGYDVLSSGDKFREVAKRYNMSIEEFVADFLPEHPDVDIKIDNEFIDFIDKNEELIVPTRIVGHLLHKNEIDHFKVYLFADYNNRLKRVLKRELRKGNKSKWQIGKDLRDRERAEKEKFLKLYNIDINDLTMYNLVIYTHFISSRPGYIKIILNNKVEYIKADNTLPGTIAGIIIKKYKELISNKI